MVVFLQQGGRTVGTYGAFGNGLYRPGLVFAPCHEDDALGAEHGSHAHGDGLVRGGGNVVVEVFALAFAGVVGEADGAGARLFIGPGLVEAHLPLFTYAYHQQVQSAGQGVEAGAVGAQLFRLHGAVRDVDVLLEDVHFVQQGLVDEVVAALGFVLGGGVVFVNGDHLHVLERHFSGLVATGQFVVQRRGSGARGKTQTEQAVLVGIDGIYDEIRNGIGRRTGFRVHVRPYFLVRMENARRQVLFNEPTFVR